LTGIKAYRINDVKKVLTKVAAQWKEKDAVKSIEPDISGADCLKKHGGQSPPTPEESAKWAKAVELVIEQYINQGVRSQEIQKG
jgi:hypothetical protein